MAQVASDELTRNSRSAKFLYYKHFCYYEPNGSRIDDARELKKTVTSDIDYPIYLVFCSWSDLNEVHSAFDEVNWQWITDVIILNEENRPQNDFERLIGRKVHLVSTESHLKMFLNSLIGESFNNELKYDRMIALNKEQEVKKRWDDFNYFIRTKGSLSATTSNATSQSST